ncbi:MAG: SurA N-terminal domain-containing protein, partial [Burkholderiaceae bacterium]|nr:SurA N-terminal domain-containing protein [Burkholderiaceae bacterium]
MLEFIRRNRLLTQIILLVFIVPSFIFFGVQGYDMLKQSDSPASVGGKSITRQEWENAQRQQSEVLRQRMGDRFDARIIESPEFKRDVLNRLIADRVMMAEAHDARLAVPQEVVLNKILEIPGLRAPDGKLDRKRYEAGLKEYGLTDEGHASMVRQGLLQQQIIVPVQYAAVVPEQLDKHIRQVFERERETQVLFFNAANYRARVDVSQEEVESYYNAHPQEFALPERMSAEMLILDLPTVAGAIKVGETDVQSYYKQNAARFAVPEERRASHILIALPASANDSDRKAAKELADSVLAKAKANPDDFAALAKAHSNDPGTVGRGGDLGFFTRGKMVRPFEEVAFAMKPGEISDVVQTDFGYHIIRLADIKPAVPRPLSAVRNRIEAEIRQQLAGKRFAEYSEIMGNMVYEQPNSLQPVADRLHLKILKVDNITRQPSNPAYANHPVLGQEKLIKALFADEVVKNKHNTDAIEITPQLLVAARAVKHIPATVRPLAEVSGHIKKYLLNRKAAEQAKEAGSAELVRLREGGAPKGFSPPNRISRQMIGATGRLDLLPVVK